MERRRGTDGIFNKLALLEVPHEATECIRAVVVVVVA